MLQFAIVGSGPAGLYTAKHLFQDLDNISVHIFEKDICPTGLIRYGMAPDHQKIKGVANDLLAIQQFNCKYFGGVEIGKDIMVSELEQMYSAIFYAYGAQNDKKLNIPGEELIYSAQHIVNWYNSHPKFYDFPIQLEGKSTIAIIGNGNVAIDISRILGSKNFENTDINEQAMEKIQKGKINNVKIYSSQILIIGRRGVVQSQFTLKELRDLSKLGIFRIMLYKPDLVHSLNEESMVECRDLGINYGNVTRGNRRKLEFMREFEVIEDEETLKQIINGENNGKINLIFRYLLSPIEIKKQGQQLCITMQQNQLVGEAFKQKTKSKNQLQKITCDMVIRSIGYQSQNIDNALQWDNQEQTLDNSNGCLKKTQQLLKIGQYACGWIKTGAHGVIDSTFYSSQETIVNFKNHLTEGMIKDSNDPYLDIVNILDKNKCQFIDFETWNKIDQYELQQGKQKNRIRNKLVSEEQMLNFKQK